MYAITSQYCKSRAKANSHLWWWSLAGARRRCSPMDTIWWYSSAIVHSIIQ